MNDLTKDELIFIKETVDTDIKYYGGDHIGHGASNKLKGMIDNYCEQHEADEFENHDFCKNCGVRFR
jgi:hypothetical protein